jgi:hypothetical protein
VRRSAPLVKERASDGHSSRVHRTLAASIVGLAACACPVLAPAAGCGGSTASQHAADAGAGADATAELDAWAGPDGLPAADAGADTASGADGTGCGFGCPPSDASAAAPCPSTPPVGGSPCTTQSQVCEYGSSWWLECNLSVRCALGSAGWVWSVESDGGGCGWLDSGGACPPTWAEAMAVEAGPGMCPFVNCVYPEGFCGCGVNCGGGGGAPRAPAPVNVPGYFVCIPAMPGCPEPRPLSGTRCDDAAAACSYGFACGCGQEQYCMGGAWQTYPSPPCP